MDFCERYSRHFVGQGYNSIGHARHYLTGLTGTQRRKNIETIENDVNGSNYQGMEQFISSSPWSHRDLLDDVARGADEQFGHDQDASLSIDESSFLKKGKDSVGVKRQWSGRAGKVESCQVAVFASLGNAERYSLIDFELFLPEEWANDPERCDKAKIPKEQRAYKPKWKLALEIVARARENEVRFGWVGVDSLYGHNNQFLNTLEDRGEKFVADVRKDFKIWTRKPAVEVPVKAASQRGKPPIRLKLNKEKNKARLVKVSDFVEEKFEKQNQALSYRQGTKGKLIARQDESGDFKYSLTNLPDPKDWQRDLYVQGQRYWIEHSFHEAKSQTGMAQYQVRVWQGWHHHMVLVCLATLFMDETKNRNKATQPLLSYRDITELLDYYLPRRHREEEEVHRQIRKRHKARQKDLDRRHSHRTGIPPDCNLTK